MSKVEPKIFPDIMKETLSKATCITYLSCFLWDYTKKIANTSFRYLLITQTQESSW